MARPGLRIHRRALCGGVPARGDDDPDVAFLLAFAARTGGPVLDLGCGAGRFLVPLAAAGYAVTGVDTSAAMLAQAAVVAAAVADRVTLVRDDFRSLNAAR